MATLTVLPFASAELQGAVPSMIPSAQKSSDEYQPPSWLLTALPVCCDGSSPPLYPNMRDFDAKRLVNCVLEVGGDLLRFEPVVRWAYFPTQSGFPTHPDLASRDLVEEVARECRKAGVHIYCYCKYGNPFMQVGWVDQHPEYMDWVLRGPNGKPYGSFVSGDDTALMQKPDFTGDAYRQAIHQIVKELCAHDIDGVYFDAPSAFGYTDICYCPTCQRKFRAFSGMDLSRLQNRDDMEARTAWFRWFDELTQTDLLEFRSVIHGSGKSMHCHNGASWREESLRAQYRIPDGFMVESIDPIYRRIMAGLMGASMARPYKKETQMYLGSFKLSNNGQPSHSHPWYYQNSDLEDGDEILMEGCAILATGNTPFYYGAARLYYGIGSGSIKPAQEVFALMRRMQSVHSESAPVPYVTVVPTWGALQLWRTQRRSWNMEMNEGLSLAMLDERINLDVCPSTEMSPAWLQNQKVIALCGASGISDEEVRLVADWVREGGGLLATYDTGLYDENGELRPGGALKDVLGVEMKGAAGDSQPECYYRIKETHPALGDYRTGAVVYGDGRLVPVVVWGSGRVVADCWNLATGETRGPAIVVNQYGKGRTVYIGGSLEAHYASTRIPSLRGLLASVVQFLAADAPLPFSVTAPRGVYGHLRRAPNGDLMLWLLANVGFKDAAVGRMRQEFVQLSNVEVRIGIPEGRQVKKMELIRANRPLPFHVEHGYAVATLPSLHIAEVVHLKIA